MSVNIKVLDFDKERASNSPEEFTQALTGCIKYLKQEAKEMEFKNTAHVLDVLLYIIKDDLEDKINTTS